MGRPNRNCDRYETQMVELACRFVYQESRERCVLSLGVSGSFSSPRHHRLSELRSLLCYTLRPTKQSQKGSEANQGQLRPGNKLGA